MTPNYGVLSYEASRYRRFSIIIAVLYNSQWRLRFRLVPTAVDGLLAFKMFSTLNSQNQRFVLPSEYQINTVLVIGIKPTSRSFKLDLRIYANKDGFIDPHNFDGMNGSVKWVPGAGRGEFFIDEETDAEKPTKRKYFKKQLYEERLTSIMPFRSQRFDAVENV